MKSLILAFVVISPFLAVELLSIFREEYKRRKTKK